MPRRVSPTRVARLQERYLRSLGATDAEIRRFRPVLTAQIGAESNFTQGIGSPAGAQDIAQFMPGTAPGYGVRLGDNKIKDDLRGQVRYMLPLLRKYGIEDALRGYNAGVGNIGASRGFSETNDYVRKVRGSADQYGGLLGAPSGGGGGQHTPTGQSPTLLPPGLSVAPGPDTTGLLASLLEQPAAPPVGQLRPSATAASAALPQGYRGIQTSGGPAPRRDISTLLDALSGAGTQLPGVTPGQVLGDAQNGGNPGGGSTKRRGRPGNGLRNAVGLVDSVIGEYGAPITAKQEPGHTVGGDHDPAVKGATARDIGGDEQTRAAIFRDLTRRLGVKNARYKGEDINVTVGGVRYQIISRDHGTGPHLHVGMRRV